MPFMPVRPLLRRKIQEWSAEDGRYSVIDYKASDVANAFGKICVIRVPEKSSRAGFIFIIPCCNCSNPGILYKVLPWIRLPAVFRWEKNRWVT